MDGRYAELIDPATIRRREIVDAAAKQLVLKTDTRG